MPTPDHNRFEELALPHLDLVYRVARRLVRNEHEAEDLVQETFLRAYRGFGDFELRDFGLRPWLLRILHNAFLNRRARERRAPRSLEPAAIEQVAEDGAADVPPELDFEQLDGEVRQALDNLDPEFRTVLLLWATKELRYREIAEVLEVPIGTVMSRLHRARKQLTDALADYARRERIAGAKTKP